MVFACQKDSFQRKLKSTVKSCTEVIINKESFYEVICEDSILFPEGGGQPWDTGFLGHVKVYKVLRKGNEAIMYVKEPVTVGEDIEQEVDWSRRFDHMQQHSGQHLITAVINAEYKIDTTSWWLGEKISHIELDTKQLSVDQISHIENLVNKKIIEQIPVVVKMCAKDDEALDNARTRGLPDDVTGPIRIVEIVGLENDLCCGTHVTNLGQLQCIKLLNAEKGKKNKINLFFVCGNRVLKYLAECLNREQSITKLLKNEPCSHVDLIEKLQINIKSTTKKLNAVLKEIAEFEAKKLQDMDPQPQYYSHYNKDGNLDYLECFLRILNQNFNVEKTLLLLAAGEENSNGNMILQGDVNSLKILGPRLTEILCGKGTVTGNRFQAKVSKLSNFKKGEELLKDFIHNTLKY